MKVYRIFGKNWSAETCDGYELDCNYATEFILHSDHLAAVKSLTSKLEIALGALKFYGDKNSYFTDHCHETGFAQQYAGSIIYKDIEGHEVAGKTAREAIQKIEAL